jgi:hypothetical protein
LSTRSLNAWTALAPLSSSAEKTISWNRKWNGAMPSRCSRKSDGSVASMISGLERDRGDEEQQRGQHRQRTADRARDHRVAPAW